MPQHKVKVPGANDLVTVAVYMGPPSCKDCFYWDRKQGGLCKRNAPSPALTQDAGEVLRVVWPATAPNDWCGQFKYLAKEKVDDSEFFTLASH